MLSPKKIEEATKHCLVKAGSTFRKDQLDAYRNAILKEKNENAKWVLERILENARVAQKRGFPLCDDTGIPHVIVELGDDVSLPRQWFSGLQKGVIEGLRLLPGRPMAVKGNPVERVEQSRGLFNDPGRLSLAPVILRPIRGRRIKITVLLLGGGPAMRAKTYRVFHQRSMNTVLHEVAGWVSAEVKHLGCTPCVVAIGIGRSHTEASSLMLEAMRKGNLNRQTQWERMVTERVNATKTGPLGLGGEITALGTFINVGPLRASGVRIVSMRPCCCFEPRRATVVLEG